MNIEAFLETTTERLPSADEFVSLCKELNIQFAVVDGKPVLRTAQDNRPIAVLISKLIAREPWRSQVIEITDLKEATTEQRRSV